jgi:branched-chain amino acid transport system permease protein
MFCTGSFFAGIAGGLYASYIIVLGTGTFTVWASLMVFLQVIVGGVGSIYGAILGAILLTVLPEFFRIGVQYEQLLSAIVVIVVVFFLPGGLISLLRVAKIGWIAKEADKSVTSAR